MTAPTLTYIKHNIDGHRRWWECNDNNLFIIIRVSVVDFCQIETSTHVSSARDVSTGVEFIEVIPEKHFNWNSLGFWFTFRKTNSLRLTEPARFGINAEAERHNDIYINSFVQFKIGIMMEMTKPVRRDIFFTYRIHILFAIVFGQKIEKNTHSWNESIEKIKWVWGSTQSVASLYSQVNCGYI